MEARPRVLEPADDVGRAIEEADLIVFGPGSLFTSVIPPLLIDGIRRRVIDSYAPKVYIANVMTQSGETDNMSLFDHLEALENHVGEKIFDEIITHDGNFPSELLENYAHLGSVPVVDCGELAGRGIRVSVADLIDHGASTARHHSGIIGKIICELALLNSGKPA